jgi:hypothetical protein
MTDEQFYAYGHALETKIYANNGGGVTIDQTDQSYEEQSIYLNLDQTRWLLDRLSVLIKQIESVEENDNGCACGHDRNHP